MAWYKVYVMEVRNKKYPMPDSDKVFIKIGHTHHMDVMKRFDPSVDDGYEKNYEDWEFTCKFSRVFKTKQEAEAFEKYLQFDLYPPQKYKVWVEDYLGLEDRNYYYNNTGITEMRLLSVKQSKWLYWKLNSEKKNEQAEVIQSVA